MNMSNEERNRSIRERARQAADNLEGFEAQLEIKPKPKVPSWWKIISMSVVGAYLLWSSTKQTIRWFNALSDSRTVGEGVAAFVAMSVFGLAFLCALLILIVAQESMSKRWKARNR